MSREASADGRRKSKIKQIDERHSKMSKKGTHDVVRSCTLPVEALSIVRALWLFHAWESKWPCWFYSAWCKGIGSSAVKRKDNNSMGHSHSEKKEPKLWRASEKKNRSELFGCATFFSFYKWSGIVITNRKKGSILLLFFFQNKEISSEIFWATFCCEKSI